MVRLCCTILDQPFQSISVLLQTLGLPTDIFQAVLAQAVQQHGTALSLRLTSRSLAHKCGAALVTGETARQAQSFPPVRDAYMKRSACSQLPTDLLSSQTAGTLYLKVPSLCGPPGEFQCWLRQVGILQRAFPNSTLRLDRMIFTTAEVDVHNLLSCTELSSVTICYCGGHERDTQF